MLKENHNLRNVVFHLLAVFAVMLNLSEFSVAGIAKALPLFDVMMIFYFAVFTNLFSIWFVFLLGIWCDAINSDPLGTTALCYILLIKFFAVLNSRMIIMENFRQVWQQFISFCFLFLLLKWLILSALNQTNYSIVNLMAQFVLSSAFYILFHKFMDYLTDAARHS